MTTSTIIPVVYTKQSSDKNRLASPISSSNRYSIQDHGQGYRTYSYEFDLADYEPEQITVLLDDYGTLRIRAFRPPCREFRREYNLGGPNVETTLVRNTMDSNGRLLIDIDVRPKRFNTFETTNNNVLIFDLNGYHPDNVTVRVDRNGLLKINGQHIDNTYGNSINREYYRQYQLPANVNPDHIRARMDANKILTVELPSSTKNYPIREYWEPVYQRNYPPVFGSGPNGAYCCCNIL